VSVKATAETSAMQHGDSNASFRAHANGCDHFTSDETQGGDDGVDENASIRAVTR